MGGGGQRGGGGRGSRGGGVKGLVGIKWVVVWSRGDWGLRWWGSRVEVGRGQGGV